MKSVLSSTAFALVLLIAVSSLRPGIFVPSVTHAEHLAPEPVRQTVVYRSGENGYDTYRIPALTVTNRGTLLAFAEGRRHSQSDTGDIDLLLKRSEDSGVTWTEQQVVWDDFENVCGNPAPIVDRDTGTVWVLMTWNRSEDREDQIIAGTSVDTRRVFVTFSDDDGHSWSQPSEITDSVKLPDWTWYATGPGAGIQLGLGRHAGRLVIPCDHIEKESKSYYSHVIFSDDHGQSWQLGGSSPEDQVNECQVAELSSGQLVLNMRNYDRTKACRQIAFSSDGGKTWTDQQFQDALVEPICQASIRRAGGSLLFSNPSDPEHRVNLTIQLSHDDGNFWEVLYRLHPGPSAYSDLALISDDIAACLYERGSESPYEEIAFARFTVPGQAESP